MGKKRDSIKKVEVERTWGKKRKRNTERRWELDDVSGAELNCIQ